MRKILVINDFPIYPPQFGGQIRIFNVYKRLSKKYVIQYICFGEGPEITETKICDNFYEYRIPKGTLHKWAIKGAAFALQRSCDDLIAMFLGRFNGRVKQKIHELTQNSDIVIASHPYMFPSLGDAINNHMFIYEAHNAEYKLKQSIFGDRFLGKVLLQNLKRTEKRAVTRADLIFTVSDQDRDTFIDLYGADPSKIHVAPNGVDVSATEILYKNGIRLTEHIIPRPLIIFLGSGHPPNVEAAREIVKNIAPRLKSAYFLICGSVCWGIQNQPVGENVGLTYTISDEEKMELFRVADVAINPMISGSGTNLKMLDFMAAGLPVISTPIGARGLEAENYDQIIICEITDIPQKIQEVIDNKGLYKKLSENGRTLVQKTYDWDNVAKTMIKALESKLQNKNTN